MARVTERWLLFKYVDGELTPLSPVGRTTVMRRGDVVGTPWRRAEAFTTADPGFCSCLGCPLGIFAYEPA